MLSVLVNSIVVSAICQANLMQDGPLLVTVFQLYIQTACKFLYTCLINFMFQEAAMHAHMQHALHDMPREASDRCVVQ